ncbi:MAG: hypothetical protein ACRDZ6_05905 [Acidimicrobiales bacterium]
MAPDTCEPHAAESCSGAASGGYETDVAPGQARRSPSLRPAAIVAAIACLIIVLGAVVALVGTSSARQKGVGGLARRVPGVSIGAVPAAPLLRRIEAAGEPPRDIVDNLTLPAGSRFVAVGGNASPVDQFDRSVTVAVAAPASMVERFYRVELSRARWILASDAPAPRGGRLLIAERAGTDGYEWIVGIEVRDSSSSISPALAGSSRSGTESTVELRLQQQGDSS